MQEVSDRITGSEKLTDLIGGWPTFHDAVVETVRIERVGPTVTIRFQLNEAPASGQTLLLNAEIRWHEVCHLEFRGADGDENNWIWGLDLEPAGEGIRTLILEMDGFHGTLTAARLEVLDVSAADPEGTDR